MKRVLLVLLGLLLAGVALGSAVLAWAYSGTEIPDPNEFADSQSSIIYYADGETELARFTGGYNRESVDLSEVPDHAQRAMLAAEDRNFYENQGVSVTGTARALWLNLTSDTTQGGSTITQQYVKNYFLSTEQTYARKFEEVLIAVKIDRRLSKEEILENYLNTIYYGRGAYGIQTASQAYFGKGPQDLTVAEGAFLAAVTNAPSLFDPDFAEGNQEGAQERFDYVIDGMVDEGWLSAQEADAATFPDIQPPEPTSATTGTAGYIATEVRQDLVGDLQISDADIDRGGLRIVTTIEQQHQQAAEAAVETIMPTSADADDLRVGLVAVRPDDGAITAMYGGEDYAERQLNNATDARLQSGSLFKVFALIAALEQGISTRTEYSGPSPMEFVIEGQSEPYVVNNFRDEQFGLIDLRTATANSVNTVYVQLNQQIGPEATRDAAVSAGLPEETPGLDDQLSNVLGPAAPTVVEMAGAYSTIAAQGVHSEPYLVSSVTSITGTYDYQAEAETQERLDPDVTADVTEAMALVVTEGSGVGAGDLGRPAAGKSGTSESNRSAWFSGFVPQLGATVGMYQGDGTEPMQDIDGLDQVTGGTYPAQIWGEFLRLAMEGEPVEELPGRVGVGDGDQQTTTTDPTTDPTTTTTTTTIEPPTSTDGEDPTDG
ncbi:MAG: penicillin-binding protein [Actinomycetota bacterium]|nr:penicillin-binding protein [Actinomycetota bacterium]